MQIAIADILTSDDVATICDALGRAQFVDGRATAGFAARRVKRNEQAAAGDRSLDAIRTLIETRLMANEVFKLSVRPKALTPLLLSRYKPGMHYGPHVDDAIMHGLRSDVAFTLFLSDPQNYDGGELVIAHPSGDEAVKLPAGSLITYPATSLHHVADVTRGERLAAVGWVRSFVRDAQQRELLFDLDTARRRLFARDGASEEFNLISKSVANLLRSWADD